VFCHPERGTPLETSRWYPEQFRAALAAAGITDYIRPFHDARHAALTNLAATGASPIVVMTTAGHRSMSTTRRYIHLAGVAFRDEANALEARLLAGELSTQLSTHLAAPEPISADPRPPETA
jgi:integrase